MCRERRVSTGRMISRYFLSKSESSGGHFFGRKTSRLTIFSHLTLRTTYQTVPHSSRNRPRGRWEFVNLPSQNSVRRAGPPHRKNTRIASILLISLNTAKVLWNLDRVDFIDFPTGGRARFRFLSWGLASRRGKG